MEETGVLVNLALLDLVLPDFEPGPNFGEEAIDHATAVGQVAADNLEYFRSTHDLVLSQIDDAHAAAPQAGEEEPVTGKVKEPRWQRAGRRRCRRTGPRGPASSGRPLRT